MSSRTTAAVDPRASRLEGAFREEVFRSLKLAGRIMLPTFVLISIWVTYENGFPAAFFFYPFLIAFGGLLIAPYLLMRAGREAAWHQYVFVFLLMAVFTVVVLVPNPLSNTRFPLPFYLTQGNELYLFLFVAGAVFTYSPRVVLWTGFAAAFVWSAATMWLLLQPESTWRVPDEIWDQLSYAARLDVMTDPYRINVGKWVRQVIVFLVGATVLAAFVRRSRQLVYRQADVERERANLSRYFSPNMVDQLAQSDEPLRATKSQEIAVLFADIVGFTTLSESRPPEDVIRLLRGFHGRMQRAVFDCGGTLDKYIGDAVMATFGTPSRGVHDACDALRCARAMRAMIEEWNEQRADRGEPPVRIGVGAHYGPVVMGDIGGEQRFEFAVIGDTVNVASRLERLTRVLDATIVVSAALVEAAGAEGGDAEGQLEGFVAVEPQAIRGRESTVRVFKL